MIAKKYLYSAAGACGPCSKGNLANEGRTSYEVAGALLQKYQDLVGTTVGAALCGRPWVKTRAFTRERVATEGHPYSCALKNPTFEAKPSRWPKTRLAGLLDR